MELSSSESEDDAVPQRKRRNFRPRINFYLDYFTERFRLNRLQAERLVQRIGATLRHETERNCALSPREQVLVCLDYLGRGGRYSQAADAHGPHKSTVCRTLQRFDEAVNQQLFQEVVNWPENQQKLQQISEEFYAAGGMPTVGGCIDGTLIRILAPNEHEPQFVDRHGNHSINALMVAGPNLQFYYCCANWPGSVHDSRILRSCSLIQDPYSYQTVLARSEQFITSTPPQLQLANRSFAPNKNTMLLL